MRMPRPRLVVAAGFDTPEVMPKPITNSCSYEQHFPAWTGGHGAVP